MENLKSKIKTALLIVNFIITVLLTVIIFNMSFLNNKDEHYIMFIGTNDQNTNEQMIDTKDAIKIIDEICLKYAKGYTIIPAEGHYKIKNNVMTRENTIICIFDFIDKKTIYKIADEVMNKLNQMSVLIEHSKKDIEYYDRK